MNGALSRSVSSELSVAVERGRMNFCNLRSEVGESESGCFSAYGTSLETATISTMLSLATILKSGPV